MPQSHSNLTSLATLLQSAEARRSALPPPPPPVQKDDSGVIDIVAMQRQAQEERASVAAAATKTPVPMVASVPDASLVSTATSLQRTKKRRLISAIAGGAALLGVAIGLALSRGHAVPPRAPVVEPPVAAATPPPAPPPVAPAVEAPAAAPVVAAAAPAPVDPPVARKPKKARRSHASSSHSKGPKLEKVNF